MQKTPSKVWWRQVPTPAGGLVIIMTGDTLRTEWAALHKGPNGREDRRLLPELAAWVRAALREPSGPPPVAVPEGPPFYRACWLACRRIKLGRTRTYAQLATSAGSPRAIRAAGGAMRANPLPLLTPCHRVLGTSSLGGFHGTARRGTALALKEKLLSIEAAMADTMRGSTP